MKGFIQDNYAYGLTESRVHRCPFQQHHLRRDGTGVFPFGFWNEGRGIPALCVIIDEIDGLGIGD